MTQIVTRSTTAAFTALTLAAGLWGCGAHDLSRKPIRPDLALATFDAADSIVYATHFDTTFHGVDWPALRAELRPQAEQARTYGELRAVIDDMLKRLGQSHFALFRRERTALERLQDTTAVERVGELGLDVRRIEERMTVVRVDPEGPAERAGIRPGWVLLSIDGDSIAEWIEKERRSDSHVSEGYRIWNRVVSELNGATGSTCRLVLLDAEDRTVQLDLVRERTKSQAVRLGNMPVFLSRASHRSVASEEHGVTVGVVWFNFWMVPLMKEVNAAVDSYRTLDGIVLDLRGNRGGVGAMVMGMAGNFFDEQVKFGVFRTRTAHLDMVAIPRRVDGAGKRVAPYAGPLAILMDEGSGSASEVFAGGLQSVGRARVFGRTSVGGVLPATTDELPNGDVLYHAFAEFITAEGTALEGRGVIPDEEIRVTRRDLLEGRDPTLEAAIRWIAEERRAGEHASAPAREATR